MALDSKLLLRSTKCRIFCLSAYAYLHGAVLHQIVITQLAGRQGPRSCGLLFHIPHVACSCAEGNTGYTRLMLMLRTRSVVSPTVAIGRGDIGYRNCAVSAWVLHEVADGWAHNTGCRLLRVQRHVHDGRHIVIPNCLSFWAAPHCVRTVAEANSCSPRMVAGAQCGTLYCVQQCCGNKAEQVFLFWSAALPVSIHIIQCGFIVLMLIIGSTCGML